MDDGREHPPDGTDRAPIAAGVSKLSPVQEAWGAFTRHSLQCKACRDVDQKCTTAGQLWRRWQDVSVRAARQVAEVGRRRA